MTLPIVIPSARRADTIKTPLYLEESGVDYRVLLHDEDARCEYVKAGRVPENKIIVTNQPKGITHQRRFISQELFKKDEWYVTMDDNISGFTTVEPSLYNHAYLPTQQKPELRKSYEYESDAKNLMYLFGKDVGLAKNIGAHYCGFASVPNFYFRSKKYRFVGYIISKAAIIQNSSIEYDPNLEAMEDFGYCAEHLVRFGRVLINNFIKPTAGHYEKGGIGTYEERLPRKIIDSAYLMEKYPGMFRYKKKKGCHPAAELQFRFTNVKQLDAWRKKFISLGTAGLSKR